MLLRCLLTVSLAFCLASMVRAEDRYERRAERRSIRGRVVSVEDGDTCTVLDEAGRRHRVCLYGVTCRKRVSPTGIMSGESPRAYCRQGHPL